MTVILQHFFTGRFLNSSIGKDFLTFMSPENLLIGVEIMGICIILIVILIYAQLLAKSGCISTPNVSGTILKYGSATLFLKSL